MQAELGGLTKLMELRLYNNYLTTVPTELGSLGKLKKLDLRKNSLTSVPAELGGLTLLETLDLSGNQLTSVPAEIGNLTALTSLSLVGNPGLVALPEQVGTDRQCSPRHRMPNYSRNQVQHAFGDVAGTIHQSLGGGGATPHDARRQMYDRHIITHRNAPPQGVTMMRVATANTINEA